MVIAVKAIILDATNPPEPTIKAPSGPIFGSTTTKPVIQSQDATNPPEPTIKAPSGPIFGSTTTKPVIQSQDATNPPEPTIKAPSGPIFGSTTTKPVIQSQDATNPPEPTIKAPSGLSYDTVPKSTEPHLENEIQKEALRKKLEYYRDKLLRIEQRNRSIMLRRVYDKWSFDLAKLVIRGNNSVRKVIEKGVVKKTPICLISDSDNSELADKDRTRLRSLFRNVTQLELETGLQETYFGFPFLVGHVGDDTYVRGPLILFPISIEYRKLAKPSGWYLLFSKEKPSLVNRAHAGCS